ncbi:hypothetical protein HMPREF0078_0615 [Anaerococcus vaginalis ATCC 51170]|uniref:Uncharacterized protein n=1 Tax=Anaerococcus vaginalis ATCC 51170 TaxID=655811 RepID=C7HTL4_9FIRM|nr:hypothetical protein HMPREF0078_0615 [Anaerococcus vaginalis ATCC 51170]
MSSLILQIKRSIAAIRNNVSGEKKEVFKKYIHEVNVITDSLKDKQVD